jgi:ribosomal protein S18 acetylase RimI-like enzyme
VDRLLEAARIHGPPVMSLTVQKANKRAVALYRKTGFRIVREQQRATDGEPEYCMELNVRPPAS